MTSSNIKHPQFFGNMKMAVFHYNKLPRTCTTIDLDLLEYDSNNQPRAFFEFKHYNVCRKEIEATGGIEALSKLADAAGLPFFIGIYRLKEDPSIGEKVNHNMIYVHPVNAKARKVLNKGGAWLSEARYAEFIYHVRKEEIPPYWIVNNQLDRQKEDPAFEPQIRIHL
jgi:hypothetical protein